ncbi:ATP-binding protein [Planomonospora sp. ID82291]|uniref:ATP-binding protein n=1 Tax=Planomonospora sp. ID82291 TaxID=2738136 RepID=UPI0018C3DBDA|nr:ATP-binding protein [Planomonospora sp. ID82291]MBG0818589.1 HAMP domain-containing protein [Planomonospora sp. ID82291]
MKWLNRSVGNALRHAFALLVSLVLLSGVVAAVESQRHGAALDRLVEYNVPLRLNNFKLRSAMGDATRGLRNHLLFAQPKTTYLQAKGSYAAFLDALVTQADRPEERRLVGDLEHRVADWFAYAAQAERLRHGDPEAPGYAEGSRVRYEAILRAGDALERHLGRRTAALYEESNRERLWGLAGVVVFVLAAVVLALLVALRTYRALVPPLGAMGETLRRLTAGEHETRMPDVGGPTEIRELGTAINTLAEESDRLRRAEQERARLAEVAHETAARIRQTLDADAVVREAVALLGARLPADRVFIRFVRDGMIGPAELEWSGGRLVEQETATVAIPAEQAERLYLQGAASSGSTLDPPPYVPEAAVRALRELGDVQYLFVPFGTGGQLLGTILLTRDPSRGPWKTEEIEAVKSVGADLGRGLDQARLYGRERELVEELRALDAAKTDFMSSISHELRSPLTSISGYLEILRDEDAGDVNPVQDRMLDAIERNTTRLRLLIEDLLTLSRIESGAFRTVKQRTDLCAVVEGAVISMRPAAAKAGVELTADRPEDPLMVDGDPNQLDRAMINVLSNAVKFTPAGGRVEVRVALEDGYGVVRVSDTGIGIPADEMQRLSTRFFRASNATELSIPGTGLGLSIVRSIVANHSGTFDLQSREGEGTTVTMRIQTCAARLAAEGDGSGGKARGDGSDGNAPGDGDDADAPGDGRDGAGGKARGDGSDADAGEPAEAGEGA